jgi:hypothetical protein
MLKIRVVNIAPVKLLGSRTFERVGGSFVNESGQEFSLLVRQQHGLVPRISLSSGIGVLNLLIGEITPKLLARRALINVSA